MHGIAAGNIDRNTWPKKICEPWVPMQRMQGYLFQKAGLDMQMIFNEDQSIEICLQYV